LKEEEEEDYKLWPANKLYVSLHIDTPSQHEPEYNIGIYTRPHKRTEAYEQIVRKTVSVGSYRLTLHL